MAFMLKALGWFADNYLGSLVGKAADYAVQQFGVQHRFQDDIENLQSSLEKSRLIINEIEKLRIQGEGVKVRLEGLLMQLKDAAYDDDDLVDEFQYQVLKKQVEQQENESTNLSLPSSSTDLPATKKPRISVSTIADRISSSRDKDRLQEIKERIESITGDISRLISVFPLSDLDNCRNQRQLISSTSRTTSSILVETEVFGRDKDLKELKDMLLNASDGAGSNNSSTPVLAIVGIGGIGKTTLAQQVYNDEAVQEHFQLKIWVCVSENFSVERLTKEIIESTTLNKCELTNLDALHVILKEEVTSKKFLLVLDDVWNEDSVKWEKFYAPLRMGVQGSKILVTTRSTKIAGVVGVVDPIHLDGLEDESFWEFFKKCVFGSQNNGDHAPDLEAIAKTIAKRLNGLPLAAKTLGGLLKVNMEKSHWEIIMNSEIWQLPQNESDILPVLQLSYQCLPAHLKRCFAFCSLFRKDYIFDKEELVSIWIAEGFVIPQGKERMEVLGCNYFEDLVSRSFFKKLRTYTNEHVMHNLIHDLTQLVSDGECYRLENGNTQENSSLARHLSVWIPATKAHNIIHGLAENISKRESYRESVLVPSIEDLHQTRHNLSVFGEYVKPERLMDIFVNERLRTLIFSRMKEPCFETEIPATHLFNRLKCVRVLILHDCGMIELPWTISRLIHLRYLDISDNFGIQRLPESLSYLHNLQYFDLTNCQVQTFPAGITNLINLRQLISVDEIISKITNIGKLINLQTLLTFKVLKDDGHKLTELSSLTQLHGRLRILNLENVEDKMEANAATLHNKVHLDELVLAWTSNENSNLNDNVLHASEEILEKRQPHSKLRSLTIRGYRGARTPSWLHTETLVSLESLRLENCGRWEDVSFIRHMWHLRSLYLKGIPEMKQTTQDLFVRDTENKFFQGLKELVLEGMDLLEELSGLGNLPCLKILHIAGMPAVKTLSPEFYGFTDQGNHFPCLEELKFNNMSEWEEWSWTEDSELFPSLLVLKIEDCPKLRRLPPLPPSLTTLELWQDGLVELPGLWNKISASSRNVIASLSKLYVFECPNLRMLEQGLLFHDLPNIESIEIHECQELLWLPVKRFKEFTSLENLSIKNCPMLMSSTEYKSDELLLPPSIQKLTLLDCGNLSEALPHCLSNLPSISEVEIGHPPSQG